MQPRRWRSCFRGDDTGRMLLCSPLLCGVCSSPVASLTLGRRWTWGSASPNSSAAFQSTRPSREWVLTFLPGHAGADQKCCCERLRISPLVLAFLRRHPSGTRASMSLGFQADRSVVGLNESVGVTVVARNDSSVAVKNLHVELVQETSWTAKGAGEVSTRVVKSVVVPGAELGAMEFGGQRGRSAAAIADSARADLEQQLAAGAGTRYELEVPADTSITLNSETIQVRHVLNVRIQGPRCVECPDVWTPLQVQPGTSSVVPKVHAETSSLAPSSTVRPVTVTVPPSVVNLTYDHELPGTSGPVGNTRTWGLGHMFALGVLSLCVV